jgi:polyribonucleotide nucleotidyltransferase
MGKEFKVYRRRDGYDEQIFINNPFENSCKPDKLRLITQDMMDNEVRKVINDMVWTNEQPFSEINYKIDNANTTSITAIAAVDLVSENITSISEKIEELNARLMILEDNIRTDTENQKSLHEILRAKYNNELIPI